MWIRARAIEYARGESNIVEKMEDPRMIRLREIDREIGTSAKLVGDIHFTITSVADKLKTERDNIEKLIEEGIYTPKQGERKFRQLKTEYMGNMKRQEEREQIQNELENESTLNYSNKQKQTTKKIKKAKKRRLIAKIRTLEKEKDFMPWDMSIHKASFRDLRAYIVTLEMSRN